MSNTSQSHDNRHRPESSSASRHVDAVPAPSDVWRFNVGGALPIALHRNSRFPDKLIVKKHIKPLPLLELRLKGVYDTHTNAFSGSCACKDTILGGRIQLDTEAHTIAYKYGCTPMRTHESYTNHLPQEAICPG